MTNNKECRGLLAVQESIGYGVLECCNKVAGFATINPVLQGSEINLKLQSSGSLAFYLLIEP